MGARARARSRYSVLRAGGAIDSFMYASREVEGLN